MFSRGAEQTVMQPEMKAAQPLHHARPEQKVEVVFEPGEERVALRYSTWTEGLGWCCQKTIRVEADQLDELHRAITVARHRISRRRADAGETPKPAQVIQLPPLS
ncbi:MAG TPA: hypothetical protein VN228_11485 [Pyrinomonadaceae bacterium]|nr:hypothetical protein [Pyrinomonadaceae bacterium]